MKNGQHVLQLLPTLEQGGAELYVQRLARKQMLEPGRFAPVVCSFLRGGPVQDLLARDLIPMEVLELPRSSISNPFRAARDLRLIFNAIVDVCRRHRIDLIQTHLSDSDWLGLLVGRKLGIPVVLTFHSSKLIPPERDPLELRGRLRTVLQTHFYHRADALVAVGRDVQKSLLAFPGVDPEKVHLVPSAIELPAERSADERTELRKVHAELRGDSNLVLVTVGRLVASKGHERLIEMMPQVLRPHPRARLWIIGDGPERNRLNSIIAERGLEKAVHLLGGRNDVADLLPAADIFVTGTHREGLGLAVAEGMAAELPVIGFQVTGIVDIIEDGANGVLVPDNDINSFANAVIGLANDGARSRALGKAGRKTAQRFDIKESRRKTELIYRSLLDSTAPSK